MATQPLELAAGSACVIGRAFVAALYIVPPKHDDTLHKVRPAQGFRRRRYLSTDASYCELTPTPGSELFPVYAEFTATA